MKCIRFPFVLLACGALLSCGSTVPSASPTPAERWWKGNLHTHTLWSDGDDYPEMVADWYARNGYDFVVLSDHNILPQEQRWVSVARTEGKQPGYEQYLARFGDDWVEQRTVRDTLQVRLKTLAEYRGLLEKPGQFLVIPGEEITEYLGKKAVHLIATNIAEHVTPQGGASVREVLLRNHAAVAAQSERTGQPMLTHINHPNFVWSLTAEELAAVPGVAWFEVYNGHPLVNNEGDAARPSTDRLWDVALTERLRAGRELLYGVATDDAHDYHAIAPKERNTGRGWIMVRAPALTANALMEAVQRGEFYASTGVRLRDVSRTGNEIRIEIDGENGVAYRTQFIGTRLNGSAGEVLAEVAGTQPRYQARGDELYVRAKIVSSKPQVNAPVAGATEVAWVQPVRFTIVPRAEAFLDTLQSRTFDFFWQTTNPRNGLAHDRYPTKSFSSIASVGFALTAYPIGVTRGYITRAQAAERTLTTLRFLWRAPQGPEATGVTGHQGFFYHFLDMETGIRFKTVELSTIDTGLLIAGVLFAQSWYDAQNPVETEIRALADSLYRRIDWRFAQARPPAISMGWHPETGFIAHDWRGYNEGMILLVLALGSPTHAIEPEAWTAWTSTYQWGNYYGYDHVGFAPLFGHQYSHVWIDFRGIQDAYMRGRGIDYFENSRRATLAQRAYAIANPNGWKGYSADIWGLTASDGPKALTRVVDGVSRKFFTYAARGASFTELRDDGTIVPTAAGGSIPFAPEVTIAALQAMRARYGDKLFREYGFLDAFNPTFTFTDVEPQHGSVLGDVWVDGDYLGIDQGPILLMAENHRTAFVWETMKRNPYIVRGLCRAGFTGGWLQGRCD